MDISVAIKRLLTADKTAVRDASKFIQVRVAAQIMNAMKTRVRSTGINAKGSPFSSYSTKECLIGYSDYPLNKRAFTRLWAADKKTMTKGRKMVSGSIEGNWRTVNGKHLLIVPGGYAEIRKVAGYQVAHKDFTVTNAMWRGVKVKAVTFSGSEFAIVYGTTDRETEQKVLGHNKREGINILLPNKKEVQDAEKQIKSFFESYVNKILNG